jgi:hypothetical protein
VLLLALVGLALVVRVGATLAHYQDLPLGLDDNNGYHVQSLLLADHGGYYDPFACLDDVNPDRALPNDEAVARCRAEGALEPSAGHPPLYPAYLAAVSTVGFESSLAHRLASCVLGAVAVGLVGLLGRRLAGDRAGLIAAGLAAIYPNLWINDGLILAESMYTVAIGLVLLAAYRFWEERDVKWAAILGLAVGGAALTRSEGATLLVFVVLPLGLMLAGEAWRRRIVLLATAGGVAVAVMVPWIAHNMGRFDEPVLLAAGTGRVLAYGNCDATYSGQKLGYWDDSCTLAEFPPGDESVVDVAHRELAMDYMSEHKGRVPVVVAARVGRMWGVYRPIQNVNFDILFERRGEWPARAGLAMYAVLLPTAVAGAVVLHRRRITIVPFVGIAAMVTFTAALTFGVTRYRVPVDVILTVLGGVAVDALWRWWRSRDEVAVAADPADEDTRAEEPVPAPT